jgi:hypothetical protein
MQRHPGRAMRSQTQQKGRTAVSVETEQPDQIEALFVQTSHAMSYTEGVLTMERLGPTALMFSDRPDRVTGHVPSGEFVDSWDKGEDSFASNPPNAVLSVFQPDAVHDVVVILTDPQYDGTDLTYQVEILDGEMPESGGEAALFIDIIGRPLSPVSVCGVHRRDRRRARRADRF